MLFRKIKRCFEHSEKNKACFLIVKFRIRKKLKDHGLKT
jgi:hypothetical protein